MLKTFNRILLLAMALFVLLPLPSYAESVNQLFHDSNDPINGNPKGKITIVEFFDYQCSHCVGMGPVISDIIKANPDVRVVYKEFPIRGPMSELAAKAALAANKQGKYMMLSHRLLNSSAPLTKDYIFTKAGEVGLNTNQLKTDMQSTNIAKQIKLTYQLAQQLQVTGTPAFFIGPTNATSMSRVKFVLGEMNTNQLQDAINSFKK